jgi:hypothetical protein
MSSIDEFLARPCSSISEPKSPQKPANVLTPLRLSYSANGYRPVPAVGKKPPLADWPTRAANATAADIRAWESDFPAAINTGILTGEVVGIDIDVLSGPLGDKLEALAYEVFGPTKLKRYGQRPKRLLVYRTKTPFKKIQSPALMLGDGTKAQVEVMGDGQQIIVSGIHPGTGKPYLWDGDSPANVPVGELPTVTEAACRDFITKTEALLLAAGATNKAKPTATLPQSQVGATARTRARTKGQLERELIAVARQLAFVSAEPYEKWWRVAAALRAEFGDAVDAFDLFDQWSATCPEKFDSDECRQKWSDVETVTAIGLGTIHDWATEGGWAPDERAVVQVKAGDIGGSADQLEDVLLEAGGIYKRAGRLATVQHVEVNAVGNGMVRVPRIVQPSRCWLAEIGARGARWEKYDARAKGWLPTDVPDKAVETLMSRLNWRFSPLAGLISAPTLRPDGSVLERPGYDEATGLLFDPEGAEFPPVPEKPTKEQAAEALALLAGLLRESPFVSPADRAVALSFILTCLVRQSLPTAPLHAFSATTAGTGKSWIVDLGALIATGKVAPVLAQGKVPEELEKKLTAALIEGAQLLTIDNCERPLEGDLLCQMLTQQSVKVRPLGLSETVECGTGCAMAATGNNLLLMGDMTRRALVCTLDASVERPELRQFGSDGHDRVREDRGRYVVAGLTLLRAFVVAGMPKAARAPLNSFGPWSRLVRDALLWLGEADPCETMERARAEDPVLARLAMVMELWAKILKDARVTPSEIIAAATMKGGSQAVPGLGIIPGDQFKHPEFREALLEVAGESGNINGMRLGKWLGKNCGRLVNGRRLAKAELYKGVQRWRLEEVAAQGSGMPDIG